MLNTILSPPTRIHDVQFLKYYIVTNIYITIDTQFINVGFFYWKHKVIFTPISYFVRSLANGILIQ